MLVAINDKIWYIINYKRQYDTQLNTMGRKFDQNHYENILGLLWE